MEQGNILRQPGTNINSFNISNSYNTILDDKRAAILEWLSPLESQKRHQDLRTSRLGGVGDWVLQTEEFAKWRDGKGSRVLFCYGDPGVGKTYIT